MCNKDKIQHSITGVAQFYNVNCRCFIVVMIAVAIAWVPVVKEMQGGQVFIYIQEITDYLAPPVAMIFLLGVLWTRCNEQVVWYSHLQFSFKSGHSTSMCSLALKEVVDYYGDGRFKVYACFMDASKAFNRIRHDKLFKIL